jgi:hypothetical protein
MARGHYDDVIIAHVAFGMDSFNNPDYRDNVLGGDTGLSQDF